MTDKQQAMKDAIAAILQARQNVGGSGPQLPPGEIEMPMDPNLMQPNGGGKMPENVDIKDPDNLLQQQKQTQQAKKNQGGQGQQPGGDPGDPGDPGGDPGDQGGQSGGQQGKEPGGGQGGGTEGQPGGQEDDPQGGAGGGSKPEDTPGEEGKPGQGEGGEDGPSGKKTDGQPGQPGGQGGEDNPDDISPDDRKGTDPEVSDAFAAAWNEMIDRFDKDDVSDDEIRTLIQKVKMNSIKKI